MKMNDPDYTCTEIKTFLGLMNCFAPSGKNVKYSVNVNDNGDVEFNNIINGFSVIDYNGKPVGFSFNMIRETQPVPLEPTIGGLAKHKHTYKNRKCIHCGCKSRKARKNCDKKTRKHHKKGGKRTRKH